MTDNAGVRLDPVERAVADIAAGKAVVVVDDEDRENEGDLIFAAARPRRQLVGFTVRYTLGPGLRADGRPRPATGSSCRR